MKENSVHCDIILTANAGVICLMEGITFMVDALHESSGTYWSSLDAQKSEAVISLYQRLRPDALLFTHHHNDHYTPQLTERALAAYPAKLLLPNETIEEGCGECSVRDTRIAWRYLKHDATLNFGDENTGYLVQTGGKTLLFPGDCAPGYPEAASLAGGPVDIAFLDFSWVCHPEGRTLLKDVLHPQHIVLFHLPFRERDNAGFGYTVRRAVEQHFPHTDVRILDTFLQRETIELGENKKNG